MTDKTNEILNIFKDIREIVANKYLIESDPVDTADAYEDIVMRCFFCGAKIKLINREVITQGKYTKIRGAIVNADHITFDDGTEAYICNDCLARAFNGAS
jgi:hypothetical protein